MVQEPSQEHRSGARQGPVGAADRHSRSAQQILDVSMPFTLEHRLQRTTWEAEPLILNMVAEAAQSTP